MILLLSILIQLINFERPNNSHLIYISMECKSCFTAIDSYVGYEDISFISPSLQRFDLPYFVNSVLFSSDNNYSFLELLKLLKNLSIRKQYEILELIHDDIQQNSTFQLYSTIFYKKNLEYGIPYKIEELHRNSGNINREASQ